MCCSSLGECATAAGVNLDYTAVIISPVQLVRAAQTESYNPTFLGIVAGDGIPNYTVSQTMNPGEVAIINCIMTINIASSQLMTHI